MAHSSVDLPPVAHSSERKDRRSSRVAHSSIDLPPVVLIVLICHRWRIVSICHRWFIVWALGVGYGRC